MSQLSYVFFKIKGTKLPAYDTVNFEGLNISAAELKKAVMAKKKMGQSTDIELVVEDEQTGKGNFDCYLHISFIYFTLLFRISRRRTDS